MKTIAPKDNPYLIGHEKAESFVLEAWRQNNLHHALLISGEKGIGKATFAYRIARFLLQADETKRNNYKSLEISPESSVFRQINSGSHPDLKVIERGYIKTDRQKIIKAIQSGNYMSDEELSDLKKSSEIVIDDIREINDFLSKSSANDNWRVVLIDCADEMNRSSSNALLKALEEPPHKTLMMLISHNPAILLPTIRSRCTKIELHPLTDNLVASLLRRYRPELNETKIKKLCSMAKGSIGKAIQYADNHAEEFYEELKALSDAGNNFHIAQMLKFCSTAATEDNYELFKELVLKFLLEKARSGKKVDSFAALFDKATATFRETEALNLDKKQAITDIMIGIARLN